MASKHLSTIDPKIASTSFVTISRLILGCQARHLTHYEFVFTNLVLTHGSGCFFRVGEALVDVSRVFPVDGGPIVFVVAPATLNCGK